MVDADEVIRKSFDRPSSDQPVSVSKAVADVLEKMLARLCLLKE